MSSAPVAASDAATAEVLQVLQVLYHDPVPEHKKRANEHLQEFQHSIEAWQTCHTLLVRPDAPLEGRLFAAQTLRTKILYDLPQLPRENLAPLRDSLRSQLPTMVAPGAPAGSRAILVQLNLALADLALQMPEWENVVGGMMDEYGKDPATVPVLLGFLKCLVEEAGNPRIPLSNEAAREVLSNLVSGSAEAVIGMLAMYITAGGVTTAIQNSVFETLRSWLIAGEVMASQVAQTPLFNALFDALPSDQLFDTAVDTICDLIHETMELEENVDVIQQIIPRTIALRPQLEEHKEDPDRIRGYCRILSEAGECYKDLIVRHTADLLPLVEAIAACTAYPDLDIVPITFNFWYALATALGRIQPDESHKPLLEIYTRLLEIIISHLHFPADDEQQTAAERDEFRAFRHRMGDTLKDCCHVLGAATCLRRSFDLVQAALAKPSPSWQEIEAPLFSMRSMGAQVDPHDDEVLPHIMDMLPRLPDHSRIRYAAILVISRYTEWIARHPQNLAFQLQYISAGFDMAEEVQSAAALAMRHMCQDCYDHLVPFLPQLLQFVASVGDKLDQSDMVEVCEAIGYIISSMPADEAAQALQQFCAPLIQKIQAVAVAEPEVSKQILQKATDAIEQIDSFLTSVHTLKPVPETCYPTALQVYQILDVLLAKYAKYYFVSERVGSLLRRGLAFFPHQALEPCVQPVLDRMAQAFEQTGFASYLWIIGKVAVSFAEATRGPGGEALAGLLSNAFNQVTSRLGVVLQNRVAMEIPDVMDDYVHCFLGYIDKLPQIALTSPVLHLAFSHTLAALLCPAIETQLIALEALSALSRKAQEEQWQPYLKPVFAQYGQATLRVIIHGVVGDFPEEAPDTAHVVLAATASLVPPEQTEAWATEAVQSIPGHLVPSAERQAFLVDLHEILLGTRAGGLQAPLNNLVRAARKARERGRQARKSMGQA